MLSHLSGWLGRLGISFLLFYRRCWYDDLPALVTHRIIIVERGARNIFLFVFHDLLFDVLSWECLQRELDFDLLH